MRRRDGVLIGTMAGMLGSLAKDVPNYVLFRLDLVDLTYWRMAASTFVLPERAGTLAGLILGAAADLILGGTLGVVILLSLRAFGRDLWWYKGLVAGNFVWLFGAGLAVNVFTRLAPLDPFLRLTMLADHQIFGLTATYLIWRWTAL